MIQQRHVNIVAEKLGQIRDLSVLKSAFAPVTADLEQLLAKIPEYIPCETLVGRKMVRHLFSNPGKMIRPALYLLSCRLVGYDGPHKIPMAAVTEFVHTASLLHDDVIDNSTLRRNKPTTNSIWGDESAILFGDLIYARASEMMAETSNLKIVSAFARAIRVMSETELLQLEHNFNLNIEESVYFRILFGKTAVLIGTACKCAGLLAGLSQDELDGLEQFGLKIGVAFQLVDDALDFMGEGPFLGKKNFIDLQEGKVTLPLIMLKQRLNASERHEIETFYNHGLFSGAEVGRICQLVAKYETAEATMARAQSMTQEALAMLKQNFPPSEQRSHLEALVAYLSKRCH